MLLERDLNKFVVELDNMTLPELNALRTTVAENAGDFALPMSQRFIWGLLNKLLADWIRT